MLALLPATAAVIGLIVLGQVPTVRDLTGIGLVILGVALHRDPPRREDSSAAPAPGTGSDTAPAPPSAPGAAGAGACSRRQGRKLGLEDLAGVDAHGCEVPGDFQADQAVQAAPDEDGAQGDGRVSVEGVRVRP